MKRVNRLRTQGRMSACAILIAAILAVWSAAGIAGGSGVTSGTALSADGLPVYYESRGDGGTALVLVHGWSCDHSYWKYQVEDLSRAFRVVTLDLGGHGQSGTERQSWTIDSFSRDVAAVVRHLGLERVILVGHSMGGPVAAGAVRLLGDRVIGLIGVDTFQNTGLTFQPAQVSATLEPFRKDFRSTISFFARSMFTESSDSALVASVAADMASAPPEVAIGALESTLAIDPAEQFAGIGIPVTAVNSGKYPTDTASAKALMPLFELRLIEGPGHFLMMEDPERFNAVLLEVAEKMSGEAG